ncbi:hypothetical protein GCM10017673_37510 [Streptosporangium violaceochromogenes]|nr:hypothetical protein GCM10017673_37510 [Streptosporangium violaceochromogenes]
MSGGLSPQAQELAARVVCIVRDEGPAAALKFVAGLTDAERLTLAVALAWCVPDDRPLRRFVARPVTSEEAAENRRLLAEAVGAPAPVPEPAWLADDPYPGGPHWKGCERSHPHCAYRLGVAHGARRRVPPSSTHPFLTFSGAHSG